jgi:hypothetical protein
MWSKQLSICTLLSVLLAGCSTLSDDIEGKLDKACQFPGSDTPQGRIVRARIALAAIAGYSYRTVDFFSAKGDVENDAMQALHHIDFALATIDDAERRIDSDKDFFPVYRSDYRVELARTAAVAAQPAIRTAKTLGTGVSLSNLGPSKAVLGSLLEDQLYLAAYEETCKGLTGSNLKDYAAEANRRIAKRCTDLRNLAGTTAPPASCADAPNAATVATAAAAPAPASGAVH